VEGRGADVRHQIGEIVQAAEIGEDGSLSQRRQRRKEPEALLLMRKARPVFGGGDGHRQRQRAARLGEVRRRIRHRLPDHREPTVAHRVDPVRLRGQKLPGERQRGLGGLTPSFGAGSDPDHQPRPALADEGRRQGAPIVLGQQGLREPVGDPAGQPLDERLGPQGIGSVERHRPAGPLSQARDEAEEALVGERARQRAPRRRRTLEGPRFGACFEVEDEAHSREAYCMGTGIVLPRAAR